MTTSANSTGIPQVNLIWRHLALWPAVLEWAWETVGPAYRSGAVAAAAERLEAELTAPGLAPLAEAVPGPQAAEVERVLAIYNRGNASNLIGLTALLQVAERSGARQAARAAPVPTPMAGRRQPASAPVPPLPRREDVAPETLALIDELAQRQGSAARGVTPSLWLHLAHWPDAVLRAHETIAPLLGTPDWQGRVERLLETAGLAAGEVAAGLRAPTRPPDAVLLPRLAIVRQFVGTTIPQMLLAGHMLAGPPPA